jgi:hypothetical protein
MTTSTQRGEFNATNKPYSVTLWGSNPDSTDNDDCWTGAEFAAREEAVACYSAICASPTFGDLPRACGYDWEFVMVDGPDVHAVTANPDQRAQRARRRRDDSEWNREIANQTGMAFGCDGYNDAMGW